MKRILAGALAALLSISTFAATQYSLALMNTTGSTSGQFIVSTGPTTAPAWATVTLSGLGGLAKASNLSDVANTSTALANLGGLSTTTAASTYLTQANATSTYGAKASPLSQFAATTSAQLAGMISDETGTGAAVFATAPTITLPNATGLPIATGVSGLGTGVAAGLANAVTGSGGAVLATSPTITTPNIVGVTNGAAAATGSVGQIITSGAVTGVALPANTATNIASIPLTAGQWLVWGNVQILPGANSIAAGGYTTSISTTSATSNTAITNFSAFSGIALAAGASPTIQTPAVLVTISAGATYFLVTNANMTGAGTANGVINALRIR